MDEAKIPTLISRAWGTRKAKYHSVSCRDGIMFWMFTEERASWKAWATRQFSKDTLEGAGIACSDPCVYLNDSATAVESVDYNSSPSECSGPNGTGGTWVPNGSGFRVLNGQVFVTPPSMAPPGSYGAFLGCMYLQDVDHEELYGAATAAPLIAFGNGDAANALRWAGVAFVVVWGGSLRSNLACSQEAGYR